jgi:hypothetical protein
MPLSQVSTPPFPYFRSWSDERKMIVSMATELTVKERAFAQLIIEGTKTAAYRKIYSDRGSPTTTAVAAYKLSRKPKIKREVARLLRQRESPPEDYARIRDVAVAGLMEMFLQEPDPRLRAKVGAILLAYANAGLKLHPVPTEKERKYEEIAQILGDVVRAGPRVINREQEQLIGETEQSDAMLLEVESENEAPGGIDLDMPKTITASRTTGIGVPLDGASSGLEPARGFDLVAIPGRFPPQFRRVPRVNP